MEKPVLYKQITGRNLRSTEKMSHSTINFVDDSTSVVGGNDPTDFKNYIEDYHTLLEDFYKINKLSMNPGKTKMIVHKHPELDEPKFRFRIQTKGGDEIQDDNAIKILGIWMTRKMTYKLHIKKMKATSAFVLNKIKPLLKNMTKKRRKIVLMSKVASILNYGGVLFAGETEENLSHYHTGMMQIIRAINQETHSWSRVK